MSSVVKNIEHDLQTYSANLLFNIQISVDITKMNVFLDSRIAL